MTHPARCCIGLLGLVLLPLAAAVARAADTLAPVERKLPVPFVEEFNDNAAGWPLTFNDVDAGIRDGRLEFENLSAEPQGVAWVFKELEQPPVGDFEIALTMAPPEGGDSAEAGLVFDMDSGNGRRIRLTRDSFRYDHHDGVKWNLDSQRWMKWAGIRQQTGEKNDLAFRVIGQRGFVLINGTAVHAVDYTLPRGRFAGVMVSAGTLAAFDRLSVQLLRLTDAARAAEGARLEREARASVLTAGPKLEPLVETFEDNRHQWPYLDQEGEWSGTIKDGELVVHNRREKNTGLELIPWPINEAADYEIRMRARHTGGADNQQISLVWARTDDGSHMEGISFSGNRWWNSYALKEGKFVYPHPWRASSAVKPSGEPNELVVRKLGDTVFLSINGQVLGDLPAARLHGRWFGFEFGPGVQAAVDELRVSYPALSAEATAKQQRELLAALEAAHGKLELGATSTTGAKKAEAAKKLASQPTKKDWDEQDKMNRRYQNKKLLSVLADRPRPARRAGGEFNPILYYHYRNIGGVDYYWEFICTHQTGTGRQSLQDVYVLQVFLTDIVRTN